jgi:hypothetical protein
LQSGEEDIAYVLGWQEIDIETNEECQRRQPDICLLLLKHASQSSTFSIIASQAKDGATLEQIEGETWDRYQK